MLFELISREISPAGSQRLRGREGGREGKEGGRERQTARKGERQSEVWKK